MNLLLNCWIPVVRENGQRDVIAPSTLDPAGPNLPVDIFSPRPDFRGALFQFLIALLQMSIAPKDDREWRRLWDQPPSNEDLQRAFEPYVKAFELEGNGPAFLQDIDLPDAEKKGIATLLIDSPGGKTIDDNLDHFVHRGGVQALCQSCAATALFTLQINAPSGGVGHRVSVRGGGPLTTLLMPSGVAATLWQKLWLNVLPIEMLDYPVVQRDSDVMPWLSATRTSDPKGVGDTTSDVVHPLQVLWSMSRRVRLDFHDVSGHICDLCGTPSDRIAASFRMRNYGINYTGPWIHPLSPYNHDPKGEKPPLSLKGQKGGIGYRHWAGLALGNEKLQPAAADVVVRYNKMSNPPLARLWCFGFDLDNMKARCWYDSTLPLVSVREESRLDFLETVELLLGVANEAAKLLQQQVRAAWFSRPADAGQEPAIAQSFWQQSELAFYRQVEGLARANLDDEKILAPLYARWLGFVQSLCLSLFDDWVLSVPTDGNDMARVVTARANLERWLRTSKAVKPLKEIVKRHAKKEETA